MRTCWWVIHAVGGLSACMPDNTLKKWSDGFAGHCAPNVGPRMIAAIPTEPPSKDAVLTYERNYWASFYEQTDDLEVVDLLTSAEQVRLVPSLGDIPLLVLTADIVGDREIDQLAYSVWLALQRELAAHSTNGRQMVIPNTTHMIGYEEPDEIVSWIRQFIQEV